MFRSAMLQSNHPVISGAPANLLQDGTFDLGNQTHWPDGAGHCTVTFPPGEIKLTADGGGWEGVSQGFPTTIGNTYQVDGDVTSMSGLNQAHIIKSDSGVSFSINRIDIARLVGVGSYSKTFTATSSTTYIHLLPSSTSGVSATFDNLVVTAL